MKRWLGVLMAFCMLFTLIPSQVFAADEPTVTIGSAEVAAGSASVSVPVTAANLQKVAGLIIRVSYPANVLAVKEGSVAYASPFESQTDNAKDAANPVQISWNAGSAKEQTYDGKLCDINFDVLSTATAGAYDITVEIFDAALNGGADITDDVKTVNGKVTITGGGSTTPEPKDVAISYVASPAEGGTVSGVATAKEGAEVTVTATPNDGYKLVKVTAGDTEVTGGKFTVPTGAASVTVTATFEKAQEEPKDVAISYVASPAEGGTVSGVATAKEGAEVTVTAAPKDGYTLVKITAGDIEVAEVKNGKFTVPTGVTSLTVTATFQKSDEPERVDDAPALTVGNATVTLGTDKTAAVSVSAANLNKVAGLIVQVTYPEGLAVKEGAIAYKAAFESQNDNAKDAKNPVQISWNAGSAKEVTYTGELCTITFDVLDTAKAGTYDVTLKVTDAALNGGKDITDDVKVTNGKLTVVGGGGTTPVTEYDIEYVTPQNGKISGAAKAAADTTVTVTVEPDAGYKLDKLTVNGNAITGTTFKMPAEKAKVEATFVVDGGGGGGTTPVTEYDIEYVTPQNGKISGAAKAAADTTVTVTATPDAGYKFSKLTVNGRDVTGTSFTMPAEKATVSATFEKVEEYDITYQSAQHGKISGVAKAAADTTVTVTVEPDDGYKLDKLTVNGEAVTGTTFKMPAGKATVSATFVVKPPQQGCYIATSVYGSYDAPEVWTLRRFRDDVLGQTWYGRLFIKAYYATSPTLVRLFGDAEWFRNFWREKLDGLVQNLQDDGFESTPYQDKDW